MTRHLGVLAGVLAAAFLAAPAAAQESSRDFTVGDRILLVVEGDTALSDTFPVLPGPAITLPALGTMSLAGVKRSEIEPYLTTQISRFVKHPVVHAKGLVRLSIEGEVTRPGFYAVPTDIVLSDVLMAAGGLTQEAKMSKMKIDRAGKDVMDGDKLQMAVAQGRTLDDLGLKAGDRIFIPRSVVRDPESKFRIAAIVLSIPVAAYAVWQIANGPD